MVARHVGRYSIVLASRSGNVSHARSYTIRGFGKQEEAEEIDRSGNVLLLELPVCDHPM